MSAVEIDVLGRFAVRRDGRELSPGELGGGLVRRLLRILACRRGRAVARDALVEALWGDRAPRDPSANLNVLVNRARRALGDPGLIRTVPGGYLLDGGEAVVVDLEVLERAAREARQLLERRRFPDALGLAQRALAAGADEPPTLEEGDAPWLRSVVDRAGRLRLELAEAGATAALAAGRPGEAADLAAAAVAAEPLREPAHLLLLRALAAEGDAPGALAAYERLRVTLAEELGIDPSPEATALHGRLLRGEPVELPADGAGPAVRPASPVFVGRDAEIRTLLGLGGDRRLALVAGRSGAGKSRLLAELAGRGPRPVLRAKAVLPEREAPWSLVRALLEDAGRSERPEGPLLLPPADGVLAGLLSGRPGGGPGAGSALEPRTWRALALQELAALVRATGPVALLVDDLQWTDSSSLDALLLLVERATEAVVVAAYRPEEVGEDTAAARFVAEVRARDDVVTLGLAPLDPPAVEQLVGDARLARVLAEETDGSPLAIIEALRELSTAERGTAGAVQRARAAARAGQQRAIWARVSRQARRRRELLHLLSLLGRPAGAGTLATAAGHDLPAVLEDLHVLCLAELARHEPEGFAVFHDMVAETVRERLDRGERARLHQLLARTLAGERAPTDELARHLAGAGDVPAAADAYAEAARERLERHADAEAGRLAEEGLALHPPPRSRGVLLEVAAEVAARRGERSRARDHLRTALVLAPEGPQRARLLSRLAALLSGAEDLHRAANLAALALAEAGTDEPARARALYVGALIDMNVDRADRARERFDEALGIFSRLGDSAGVLDILDARAMARFMDGEIVGGAEALGDVAGLFEDSGNLLRVVTPRSTCGHGLVFAGRPEQGVAETQAALRLARMLGYPEGESVALWQGSEALAGLGRAGEALAAADEALAVARRVGHRGWTATALRARGIALTGLGDLAAAEAAFRESLDTSEHLALFESWARARLAMVAVRTGRAEEAAVQATLALRLGPPLGHYEARLARCQAAVALGEDGAATLVAEALARAEAGGHAVSAAVLRRLQT